MTEKAALAGSLTRLLDSAGRYAAAKLSGPLDEAITAVKQDETDPDAPMAGAAVGVVQGATAGKNPALAAAQGAWRAMDTKAKVAVGIGLVLLVLLAPVVLPIGLLVVLVVALVRRLRAVAAPST